MLPTTIYKLSLAAARQTSVWRTAAMAMAARFPVNAAIFHPSTRAMGTIPSEKKAEKFKNDHAFDENDWTKTSDRIALAKEKALEFKAQRERTDRSLKDFSFDESYFQEKVARMPIHERHSSDQREKDSTMQARSDNAKAVDETDHTFDVNFSAEQLAHLKEEQPVEPPKPKDFVKDHVFDVNAPKT